jgi:hypothetical protein
MSTAPTILFDESAHIYSVDGIVQPNVTSVLQNCGLIDFSAVPDYMLEWGRERGTAVHKAAHYMLADDLDYESLDPILGVPVPEGVGYLGTVGGMVRIEGGYLGSLQRWMESTRCQVDNTQLEKRLYNPLYGYCGTLDMVCTLPDALTVVGRRVVVDFKSGGMSGVRYQLAAYAMASDPKIAWRLALKLNKIGPARAYLFGPETLMHDYNVFLAALAVEREKRRIRR